MKTNYLSIISILLCIFLLIGCVPQTAPTKDSTQTATQVSTKLPINTQSTEGPELVYDFQSVCVEERYLFRNDIGVLHPRVISSFEELDRLSETDDVDVIAFANNYDRSKFTDGKTTLIMIIAEDDSLSAQYSFKDFKAENGEIIIEIERTCSKDAPTTATTFDWLLFLEVKGFSYSGEMVYAYITEVST